MDYALSIDYKVLQEVKSVALGNSQLFSFASLYKIFDCRILQLTNTCCIFLELQSFQYLYLLLIRVTSIVKMNWILNFYKQYFHGLCEWVLMYDHTGHCVHFHSYPCVRGWAGMLSNAKEVCCEPKFKFLNLRSVTLYNEKSFKQ